MTSAETPDTVLGYAVYEYGDSRHPNGLTAYDGDTVIYDANGNPLTYRGYTMNWEKGRQLSELSGNGIAMSFKYDNNGIRTKKTVNNTDTDYFYVGDTLVSQKTGDEVINFAYTAGGAPYGFTYNGTSYFYLTNIQGDIIGIYDINGNVVVNYVYDSWGKLVSITGSLADTVGVKNPLRYRGYYYDTETGLYYLQSRYYDPDTCRFINADSLLIAGDYVQGINMFAYCLNNPVMYCDPSGRESEAEKHNAKVLVQLFIIIAIIGQFAEILGEENAYVFAEFLERNVTEDMNLDGLINLLVNTYAAYKKSLESSEKTGDGSVSFCLSSKDSKRQGTVPCLDKQSGNGSLIDKD